MCGIFGYVGEGNALQILIEGLKRLEYRGYDSAGTAILSPLLQVSKAAKQDLPKNSSPILSLEQKVTATGTIGIAHTRWATHGIPDERNAHPHICHQAGIAVVHNGIIENYRVLREYLAGEGHAFASDTDSEVIAHLIAQHLKNGNSDPLNAVQKAVAGLEGTYGLAVVMEGYESIIAARCGSPLIIGVGQDGCFLSSDSAALTGYTNQIVRLEDKQVAKLDRNNFTITGADNREIEKNVEPLTCSLRSLELGESRHYMHKEIFGQPSTIHDAYRGRLGEDSVRLDGLREIQEMMGTIGRIRLIGCGTSWHAAKIGKYILEGLARIPAEAEYASEFRHMNPVLQDDELIVALSQSGETFDTIQGLIKARQSNRTFGIVNAVGSMITRETDAGIYIHAGPEIGVASTKAFTGQVACIYLMALQLGIEKGYVTDYEQHKRELELVPGKIEMILKNDEMIKSVAEHYSRTRRLPFFGQTALPGNYLFLGRGTNFPVALEGALKMKEISGLHAEGYPAAEMKHGPIALIDRHMPVVFIATGSDLYDKVLINMEEVKTRRGRIITISDKMESDIHDQRVSELSDHIIRVPATNQWLSPLINVIPLQLLAYHTAVHRKKNPDKPDNLAKAVTVE